MREYLSWSARARVRSRVVLPSPGTPSSSTCPPESRQISTPSTTSSWPTIILAISRRTAFNRSTAFCRVASDPTFLIVEQHAARHGIAQGEIGRIQRFDETPLYASIWSWLCAPTWANSTLSTAAISKSAWRPSCGLDSSDYVNELVRREFAGQAPAVSAPAPESP